MVADRQNVVLLLKVLNLFFKKAYLTFEIDLLLLSLYLLELTESLASGSISLIDPKLNPELFKSLSIALFLNFELVILAFKLLSCIFSSLGLGLSLLELQLEHVCLGFDCEDLFFQVIIG